VTRTGGAAIDYARARIGPNAMPASGYCLAFTRECFAVPALYGSAIDAAYACNAPHPGDWDPPAGTPVWFRSPSIYDHVAFYVGPHEVISTFNADVRAFDGLRGIEASFDATFVGWGEDINEVHILEVAPPPPPPPPPPLELSDVTAIIRFIDTGEIEYLSDSGVITPAATPEEVHAMAAALRLPQSWVDLDSFEWTRVHQAAERIRANHRT
jgi:hypothetical protein